MTSYLVYSYDYTHASAGQKVLHRLCHELNLAGQSAYVAFATRNPEWATPFRTPEQMGRDWVAVYPEIVSGNPWGAKTVARWVLNTPGLLGGDREYASSEIVFTWSRLFHPTAPLLTLHSVETDIYSDEHRPRSGAAVYAGKGGITRGIPGAREVTLEMRQDRHALADFLNSVEVLYCFDPISAMVDVARLCGCPVVVVPNGMEQPAYGMGFEWNGLGWGEMPEHWDPAAFRAAYVGLYATFRRQLEHFITLTQVAHDWHDTPVELWAQA